MTNDVTQLLEQANAGDEAAMERLVPLVYDELRGLAGRYLRRERADHTLQPTALVHEAYVRLVDQSRVQWNDRGHFFAIAATAMRRVLVNHARDRGRLKRAGNRKRVNLDEALAAGEAPSLDLVALDEALERLAEVDERKVRIVELRYFAGLSIEDVAEATDVAPATVKREWSLARAWLLRELRKGEGT